MSEMGKREFECSSFDNNIWGFVRVQEVNPVRIKCKHCGWSVNFIVHKKRICSMCKHYVYPDDKEEFREKVKRLMK